MTVSLSFLEQIIGLCAAFGVIFAAILTLFKTRSEAANAVANGAKALVEDYRKQVEEYRKENERANKEHRAEVLALLERVECAEKQLTSQQAIIEAQQARLDAQDQLIEQLRHDNLNMEEIIDGAHQLYEQVVDAKMEPVYQPPMRRKTDRAGD